MEEMKVAQAILNEALDKATVVYASEAQSWQWTEIKDAMDTHKALLINVEPIKKCEHKSFYIDRLNGNNIFKCCDCNKELIPTGFKVKE